MIKFCTVRNAKTPTAHTRTQYNWRCFQKIENFSNWKLPNLIKRGVISNNTRRRFLAKVHLPRQMRVPLSADKRNLKNVFKLVKWPNISETQFCQFWEKKIKSAFLKKLWKRNFSEKQNYMDQKISKIQNLSLNEGWSRLSLNHWDLSREHQRIWFKAAIL